MISDIRPYNPAFGGGVYVATGDINGDGVPDIITGAGEGGGPHVRVFDGATGERIYNDFPFSASLRGGVRVASGDVNGDGFDDIVVATGPGSATGVKVISGADGATLHSFTAYTNAFQGGSHVTVADVNGDGLDDIITSADIGGGPHVKVFDGGTGERIGDFFAYNVNDRGGVRVMTTDINGDGIAEIVTSPASSASRNQTRAFDSRKDFSEAEEAFDVSSLGMGFIASAPAIRDAINTPPELVNQISYQTARADSDFNFTVPADTFRDRNWDDVLTYSATRSDGNPLPTWLSFDVATQTFAGTPAAGDVGEITVTVTVDDNVTGTASDDFSLTVQDVATPQPTSSQIVIGSGSGKAPWVQVIDATTGNEVRRFLAYNSAFRGGVDVAMGDINNDGVDDIITAAGPSGGPHVRVFDGETGVRLASFFAFDVNFRGGVTVASGDVNNDGVDDIITGAGPGGGPVVKVFDGVTLNTLQSFFAYSPSFGGGVDVAAGDVNGDGHADIITGAGPNGGPHVKVFDGNTGSRLHSFFAFNAGFTGGVNVSAGDINGDGLADIITGPGIGRASEVKIFDARTAESVASATPFGAGFTGGVSVGSTNANNDSFDDIVVGKASGNGPNVKVLDGDGLIDLDSFFAFDPAFTGGALVD